MPVFNVCGRSRDGTANAVFASLWVMVALLCAMLAPRAAFAAPSGEAVGGSNIVRNEVIRGGVKVKKSLPLGTAQGDTVVEGTEFWIYPVGDAPVFAGNAWTEPEYTRSSDGTITLDENAEPCLTIVAGADGVATSKKNDLPYGRYVLVEGTINDGQAFALNAQKTAKLMIPFTISEDGKIVDLTGEKMENPPVKTSISVNKRDSQTGSAQGEASLAGAKFDVYNRSKAAIQYTKDGVTKTIEPGKLVDTITTDAKGYGELPKNSIDYGTYEVIEVAPPTGYQLSDPAWTSGPVKCHDAGAAAESGYLKPESDLVRDAGTAKDDVITGGAKIVKMDRELDSAVPQGDGDLAAEYTIYNATGSIVMVAGKKYNDGDPIITIKANAITGEANTPKNYLPYGTYKVKETKPPKGYLLDPNWSYTFKVDAQGKVYEPSDADGNKNEPVRGGISVKKVDLDTYESEPQGGATFEGIKIEITNASGGVITYNGKQIESGKVVCTIPLKYDAGSKTWVAETGAEALPYGTYKLRELAVDPKTGYLTNLAWNPTVRIPADGGMAVVVDE